MSWAGPSPSTNAPAIARAISQAWAMASSAVDSAQDDGRDERDGGRAARREQPAVEGRHARPGTRLAVSVDRS